MISCISYRLLFLLQHKICLNYCSTFEGRSFQTPHQVLFCKIFTKVPYGLVSWSFGVFGILVVDNFIQLLVCYISKSSFFPCTTLVCWHFLWRLSTCMTSSSRKCAAIGWYFYWDPQVSLKIGEMCNMIAYQDLLRNMMKYGLTIYILFILTNNL